MAMSKKHFQMVAQSLRDLKTHIAGVETDNEIAMAVDLHIQELCIVFKQANPSFNKQKFKDAIQA